MRYIVYKKNALQKIKPYINLLVATALIVLVVGTFILDIYKIPTQSMQPTLLPGEHVIGLKIVYGIKVPFTNTYIRFSEPQHGDVVSIKRPEDKIIYIKRIVALPMESVDFKNGDLVVLGRNLKRNYATGTSIYKYIEDDAVFQEDNWNKKYFVSYSNQKRIVDMEKPFVCGADGYFVMGDNRTNSIDSRKWGEIKRKDILTKAAFIFFSEDPDTGAIRWDRIGFIR